MPVGLLHPLGELFALLRDLLDLVDQLLSLAVDAGNRTDTALDERVGPCGSGNRVRIDT